MAALAGVLPVRHHREALLGGVHQPLPQIIIGGGHRSQPVKPPSNQSAGWRGLRHGPIQDPEDNKAIEPRGSEAVGLACSAGCVAGWLVRNPRNRRTMPTNVRE